MKITRTAMRQNGKFGLDLYLDNSDLDQIDHNNDRRFKVTAISNGSNRVTIRIVPSKDGYKAIEYTGNAGDIRLQIAFSAGSPLLVIPVMGMYDATKLLTIDRNRSEIRIDLDTAYQYAPPIVRHHRLNKIVESSPSIQSPQNQGLPSPVSGNVPAVIGASSLDASVDWRIKMAVEMRAHGIIGELEETLVDGVVVSRKMTILK